MRTKKLAIIFSLFLLIALAGGLAVFLNQEKSRLPAANIKSDEVSVPVEPVKTASTEPGKTETPLYAATSTEEKINAAMIIGGVKYEAEVKPGSLAYDAMNYLKTENKINFSGKNYSGLGFFVEEINGVKNNPSGENWIYYVNGNPAQVGISNYLIKSNDIIEWKYSPR